MLRWFDPCQGRITATLYRLVLVTNQTRLRQTLYFGRTTSFTALQRAKPHF
jgi:hypothetical protein